MHRAGKRAELLSNTDRKKILEILKMIGLCMGPMMKLNGKIIDALRKFQDPLGVKAAQKKRRGIQEMTFENNLLLDAFVRAYQECSGVDCTGDPVFQILCEGQFPDVAFFCKKVCQPTSTMNVMRRSHNKYHRDVRNHGVQPICRDCARTVVSPPTSLGLDFYRNASSSADMFAEWKYTFGKLLNGYRNFMALQKDLFSIASQVDPKNSTPLRTMMKNKELERNHDIISKLMKELKGPIDLDDLFICICCNPPQTAGGRMLNGLNNGVKKNVNCLEGGFFAPPKDETKSKNVDETKSNDTDEGKKPGQTGAGEKPEIITNEPNGSNKHAFPRKCNNKELFLRLKNGTNPNQMFAELSSGAAAKEKDNIYALKCFEQSLDDGAVKEILESVCGQKIACGYCELKDDELVLTKTGNDVITPEIRETVLSLMSDYRKREKEQCGAKKTKTKFNLRRVGVASRVVPDKNLTKEDLLTSVNVKASKVTVTTVAPEEARVNINSNKRRTTQVVYVSSPNKNNNPGESAPVIKRPPTNAAESESEDELFQGPAYYDRSNDRKSDIQVADKSTQTMKYNGEDYSADNYWLLNPPKNAQETQLLTQSHTFRKTMRVRQIANKVYEKPVELIQS